MHTTISDKDAAGIQNYFATGAQGRGVGTQFVIGNDGKVIQMVEMFEDKIEESLGTANHNAGAINIEMTHTGVYGSKNDAPAAQYQAALSLVKKLMQQYRIPKGNIEYDWKAGSDSEKVSQPGVFGHYQLNPSNREDPGIGFMKDFREDL
jgi:N-acetyl-anhydromuramyl-L-alanine amidase AmpD